MREDSRVSSLVHPLGKHKTERELALLNDIPCPCYGADKFRCAPFFAAIVEVVLIGSLFLLRKMHVL